MKKINSMVIKAKNAMSAKRGEAYIDTVVKIVIIAVLGLLVFGIVKGMTEGLLGKANTAVDNLSEKL